jgi:hypothetical protein
MGSDVAKTIFLAAPVVHRLGGEPRSAASNSLRLAVLTGGSESTGAEAVRMVSERMPAALEVQRAAAIAVLTGNAGLIPARTIAIYRQKIRANRRRLRAAKTPATELAHRAVEGVPT